MVSMPSDNDLRDALIEAFIAVASENWNVDIVRGDGFEDLADAALATIDRFRANEPQE